MSAAEVFTTPPTVLGDLRYMGRELSDLESTEGIVRNPDLKTVLHQKRIEIFAATADFVNEHPEIATYYGYALEIGEEAAGDEIFYEATLFRELFAPELPDPTIDADDTNSPPKPAAGEQILYIDGKEFTRDEGLMLFVEILHCSAVPLRAEELRRGPLGRFINAELNKDRTALFAKMRESLKERLEEVLGSDQYFHEYGLARGKRYWLELGGFTVMRSVTGDMVTIDAPKERVIPEETSTVVAKSVPKPSLPIPEPEPETGSEAEPETAQAAAADPEPPMSEAEVTKEAVIELTIRGAVYEFTPTQRRIIDALLDGNGRIRDIIGFLQGGNEWAEQDYFYTVIKPALEGLTQFIVDGEPLVRVDNRNEGASRHLEYALPPGARIEFKNRGQVQVLRFVDPSLPNPEKAFRRQLRAGHSDLEGPTTSQLGVKPTSSPAERKIRPPKKAESIPAVLEGDALKLPSGEVRKLDFQTRRILEVLSSGERLTVSEIVKALGAESESTFNNIIAGELQGLQTILGVNNLRRKQKSGQPARWWLEEGTLRLVVTET